MNSQVSPAVNAARIEGGIDAIVIGASLDGLVAAAYLGKAGLKTILIEPCAEVGASIKKREFAAGFFNSDCEHLISILDPTMLSELDLYRHGVSYASRRLDTTYFFDDGTSLALDGDIKNYGQKLGPDEVDFDQFIEFMLEASSHLSAVFEAPVSYVGNENPLIALQNSFRAAPPAIAEQLGWITVASANEALARQAGEGPAATAMLAEAAFRSQVSPSEAFGFLSLFRKFAGETAGLQGAIAFQEGGADCVIDALRRAVQAAGVEIRASTPVQSILVEWDRAAGVELGDGGQIRAPIIIASADAKTVYTEYLDAAGIDIDLQQSLDANSPAVASAQLHVALKGVARDEATKEKMRRRLVYAPNESELSAAFAAARSGDVPEQMILEAVFPSAFEEKTGAKQILSVIAHPVPLNVAPGQRADLEQAILTNLERIAAGIGERIIASEMRLPEDFAQSSGYSLEAFAAKPSIVRQWAQASAACTAGRISGFYFCGPEAQIGAGLSGSAGRVAAKAALRHAKLREESQ